MDLALIQTSISNICELVALTTHAVAEKQSSEFDDECQRIRSLSDQLARYCSTISASASEEELRKIRHDLRNILGAITGYGEILWEESAAGSHTRLRTEKLFEEIQATLDLIEPKKHPSSEQRQELIDTYNNSNDKKKSSSGQLLVIDDNEYNRDLLSHYLQKLGHQVTAIESAKQATLVMQNQQFDLILLDLLMPEIDGYQFLKQLKASDQWRAIPVIMVSGIDDTEGVVQCISAGAEDYLTKPFNPILLEARLSACLERKRWHDKEISYLDELEKRNRFIRRTFGRYLTDEIVDNLLENPAGLDLGGTYKKVTILMTDLRNFTNLCEQMAPDLVVRMLNNYLGIMTKVIMAYKGTVDEFIGDAILALFGAPIEREDDADRAIACAIAMQLAMAEVNAKNSREGLPNITMGIGINTGEVIAGNIGSEQRLKYAVVGQHVNLTARIENLTHGGQIFASQHTVDAATSTLTIHNSKSVQLKGIREKIPVHEITGIQGIYNLQLPN